MAFRLERGEDIGKSVRRLLLDEVDAAIKDLSSGPDKTHEGIHEARKRFKKLRGVLRFARTALAERYAFENAQFRDLARSLSELRDAQALVEAIDGLSARYQEPKHKVVLNRAKEILEAQRNALADLSLETQLSEARATLKQARTRLRKIRLPISRFKDVADDVRGTYRRGRRALQLAYDRGEDVPMHELRKASKYLWHHVRILEPVWPALMDPYGTALKELSDLLGEHHDLTVLTELLQERRLRLTRGDKKILGELITRRKAAIHREARSLAARVYAEMPKRFVARIASYHDAFQFDDAPS